MYLYTILLECMAYTDYISFKINNNNKIYKFKLNLI